MALDLDSWAKKYGADEETNTAKPANTIDLDSWAKRYGAGREEQKQSKIDALAPTVTAKTNAALEQKKTDTALGIATRQGQNAAYYDPPDYDEEQEGALSSSVQSAAYQVTYAQNKANRKTKALDAEAQTVQSLYDTAIAAKNEYEANPRAVTKIRYDNAANAYNQQVSIYTAARDEAEKAVADYRTASGNYETAYKSYTDFQRLGAADYTRWKASVRKDTDAITADLNAARAEADAAAERYNTAKLAYESATKTPWAADAITKAKAELDAAAPDYESTAERLRLLEDELGYSQTLYAEPKSYTDLGNGSFTVNGSEQVYTPNSIQNAKDEKTEAEGTARSALLGMLTYTRQLAKDETLKNDTQFMAAYNKAMKAYEDASGKLQSSRKKLSDTKETYWSGSNAVKYGSISENEDFAKNSYVSPLEKDILYRYVNDLGDTRQQENPEYKSGGIDLQLDRLGLSNTQGRKIEAMTQEEVSTFNYLWNTKGKTAAEEYLNDYLDSTLNRRVEQKDLDKWEERTASVSGGIIGSLYSVPENLISGIGYIDLAVQKIRNEVEGKGRPLDYSSPAMRPGKVSSAIRESVAENLGNAAGEAFGEDAATIASFLYQTGMSMADSAAVAGISMLGIPGAAWLLGGSAATQAAIEVQERGGTELQSLAYGLAAGVAEEVFEKISLDKLLSTKAPQNRQALIKSILAQAGVEGSEEVFTTLANTLTDRLINGNVSDLQTKIREYKRLGYQNPEKEAWKEWAVSLLADGIGGMLSGGIMGGVSSTIKYSAYANTETDLQNAYAKAWEGRLSAAEALKLSYDEEAVKTLQDNGLLGKLDEDEGTRIGQITNALYSARNIQAAENQYTGTRAKEDQQTVQSFTEQEPEKQDTAEAEKKSAPAENKSAPAVAATAETAAYTAEQAKPAQQTEAGKQTEVRTDTSAQLETAKKRMQNAAELEETSLKTQGVQMAADTPVRILPENAWDGELQSVAAAVRAEGMEPVFIAGKMQVETESGTKTVGTITNGNRLYIQATNTRYTAQELAEKGIGKSIDIQPQQTRAKPLTKAQTREQNTRSTAKQYNVNERDTEDAVKLGKMLKADIRFYWKDAGTDADGNVSGVENGKFVDGVIWVNAAVNQHTVTWVVAHELTHSTEAAKAYESVAKLAKRDMGKRWEQEIQLQITDYADFGVTLNRKQAEQETVANWIANRLLTDEDAVQKVVDYNRTAAAKVRDFLKNILSGLGHSDKTLELAVSRFNRALDESQKAREMKLPEVENTVPAAKPVAQTETTSYNPDNNTISNAVYGDTGTTFTEGNASIAFRWAAVPGDALIISHDGNGEINNAYPAELQPRDRSRTHSRQQIQRIANDLNPEKLAVSAEAQNGAPIIREDGVVIGGNARSAAILKAYQSGKAERYESYLRQNAEKFGLNAEKLPNNPVLVRIAENRSDWAALARELNVSTISGQSATENAMSDAKSMENAVSLIVPNDDGNINTTDNLAFIQEFLKTVPENERAGLITADGLLSQEGLRRAENAVFAYAYQSAALLKRIAESTDNDIRSITNAMVQSAAAAAEMQAGIKDGTLYDIPAIDAVKEAVDLYLQAKEKNESLQEYLGQMNLFGGNTAEGIRIAMFLEENKRNTKLIRTFLNALYNAVTEYGDPNQTSLFGEEVNYGIKEAVDRGGRKYGEETGRGFPGMDAELDSTAAEGRAAEEKPAERSAGEGRTENTGDNGSGGTGVKEEAQPKKERKPKKSEKPKTVETTERLADFGEKIGGARKDWRADGLTAADIDSMNEREREKNIRKDNVWKRPDYKKRIEGGADRGIQYAINEIRKSVNANPAFLKNEKSEAGMKLYIDTIRKIQEMAEQSNSKKDFAKLADWLLKNGYIETKENMGKTRLQKTDAWRANPALLGSSLLETIATVSNDRTDLIKAADKINFAVDSQSKIPAGLSIAQDTKKGDWYITKGTWIIKDGFNSYDSAMEFLQNAQRAKTRKTRFVPEQLLEVHRKGPNYRNSQNVNGQNYLDTFGFRGGEFGNWMTEKDRQASLNYGYDALMDLADALNMDYRDISLGGNLSIAFGARGEGLSGAAAHYENLRHVINLTKMNGAGSLAHEWFHALDDYLGGYGEKFATESSRKLPEATKTALRNLVQTMQYIEGTAEEADLAKQKNIDRAERTVSYTLKDQFPWVEKVENGSYTENKYYAAQPTAEDAALFREYERKLLETGDSAMVDKLSELRKKINGHVIAKETRDALQLRILQLRPEARENTVSIRKYTKFYEDSREFANLHAKDGDYWDSTVEMAARAFATYIYDKLNGQNDYLEGHANSAASIITDKNGDVKPIYAFPRGEERTRINGAFDSLIEAIKQDGFLKEQQQTERPEEARYSLERVGAYRGTAYRNQPSEYEGREVFTGTKATDALGIKIAGSVGRYGMTESVKANQKELNKTQRQIRKLINDNKMTEDETAFAKGVADQLYDIEYTPKNMRAPLVQELADLYFVEASYAGDLLGETRRRINEELQWQAQELLDEADFTPQSMLKLNERTSERNLRAMFGDKLGNAVWEWAFRPVEDNANEIVRFYNRQMEAVRLVKDQSGQMRELTREESALTMMLMEGTAAAEQVASMEMSEAIMSAAQKVSTGTELQDAMDNAGLNSMSKEQRSAVQQYSRWLQTKEAMKNADSTIIENAAKMYREQFDKFYDAINDVLVAHGYAPIGFIKGYAPHTQPQAAQSMLDRALGSLGINNKVTQLPTDIAGRTADFKPNKRWVPYFLSRKGSNTEYDIVKNYQSYVDYVADVIYHIDDIMRIRQLSNYLRKSYSASEIQNDIEWTENLRYMPKNRKLEYLKAKGEVKGDTVLSAADTDEALDRYVDKLYQAVKNTGKYSNLVMWLDNYANILAAKQSMADRGWEYSVGREALNMGNRLQSAFQRANVAGNLSSVLNQFSQIGSIYGETGKYMNQAIRDIMTGKTKAEGWTQQSDFLISRAGKELLYTETTEKILNAMFKPAQLADSLVSTIAVRAAYLQAADQGASFTDAMKQADLFGRRVMASRVKGVQPLAYESKGFFSRMIHMFQVECANSWDHIISDLPADFRRIAASGGVDKAIAALVGVIMRTLVGGFMLNRITEEVYGGTPAMFDLLGLSANFIASGKGLTTNEYLKTVFDNVWEQLFEERLFDTAELTDGFKTGAAIEDLTYNVSNELPMVRNLAGVFGVGDQSMALPGSSGEFTNLFNSAKALFKEGVSDGEIQDFLVNLIYAAGTVAPGGRQITKTVQGSIAAAKGGSYRNGKMQYPVEGADAVRAVIFGKNATEAAREYYASGDSAFSAKYTEAFDRMTGAGMEAKDAYSQLQAYKKLEQGYEKGAALRTMVIGLNIPDKEKIAVLELLGASEAQVENITAFKDAGLSVNNALKAYSEYLRIENAGADAEKRRKEFAQFIKRQTWTQKQKDLVWMELTGRKTSYTEALESKETKKETKTETLDLPWEPEDIGGSNAGDLVLPW